MPTTPLTDTQAKALVWVVEHPGCATGEVARALGLKWDKAQAALASLHHRRLVGRQGSFSAVGLPAGYFAENKALEAYERAQAALAP